MIAFFHLAVAGTFHSDQADFVALESSLPCDWTSVYDFEEQTLGAIADDAYVDDGLHLSTSTYGAVIDDDVDASACRDSRCVRVPSMSGYGTDQAPWFSIAFDTPVAFASFWLIDFGTTDGQLATVVAERDGAVVDTLSFEPGGNDVDGGVFVGLELASEADTITLFAEEAGDGIGFDDLWFPDASCIDHDGDGQSAHEGDCDESDPSTYEGAEELCDGLANACGDLPPDEGDVDFDGWLDCEDTDGDGVPTLDDKGDTADCAPWDATTYPDAPELCDGLANACGDLPPDEGDVDFDGWLDCEDTDGDGVPTLDDKGDTADCAPWDATTYPDAPELCDGLANTCGDLPPDEGDVDFDGYVDCLDTDGDGVPTVDQDGALADCAPWDATTYPDAPELCDGLANTCGDLPPDEGDVDFDGYVDCLDTDGDGVPTVDGDGALADCDPWDATTYPDAPELCDGRDNRCVGEVSTWEADDDQDGAMACEDPDGDGWTAWEGDCDPWSAAVFPGADELCDGIDNACRGYLLEDERDHDADGFATCSGDCDDDDPTVFPDAPETANGFDADCDGTTTGAELRGCSSAPAGSGLFITGLFGLAMVTRRRS